MNTLWRKAIRDFWHERARTALVVLAIALGISAFAAVLSSYAILTHWIACLRRESLTSRSHLRIRMN